MLFKNSVRTSKRTPHFTITNINWLTLFKFNYSRLYMSSELFHILQPSWLVSGSIDFFLWHSSPHWALSSSLLRFLNHTHNYTHGRTPLDEWSARRRDLYLHRTTQQTNTRDKHPCIRAGFEPAISATKRSLGSAGCMKCLWISMQPAY
jgi:thiosulfate reductase cytochrome b subunit